MLYPPIDPPTAARQTLDEVRQWRCDLADILATQQASIADGGLTPPPLAGLTEVEIDARLDVLRIDLDRATTINLIASAEATIRVDYARRVRKGGDALSRAYQAWHRNLPQKKQLRPDFDEAGILAVMKGSAAVNKHVIGRFRECLRSRHWLGHGRYWAKPIEVDKLDSEQVYGRALAIVTALPA